jgi:hypothetical protein
MRQALLVLVAGIAGVVTAAGIEPPPPTTAAATTQARVPGKGKGPRWEMPGGMRAALDGFRAALRANEWDKALSFCTEETRARAKEYGTAERYLRDYVPIKELLAEADYMNCGGGWRRGATDVKFTTFFVRLPQPGSDEDADWDWSVEELGGSFRLNLPEVTVAERVKREQDRRRRQKAEAEARWQALEPKLAGLRTELVALPGEYRVGGPICVRLELVNGGQDDVFYDSQHVGKLESMTITAEDGSTVRYTAGFCQTCARYVAIRPGEMVVLLESLDLAQQYAISEPGKYCVQFNGHGLSIGDKAGSDQFLARRQFPSNSIEIVVRP